MAAPDAPSAALTLAVSPSGRPRIAAAEGDEEALTGERASAIRDAFERGPGAGVLHLGAVEVGTSLPPSFAFFRDLGHELVARLCARTDLEALRGRARVEPPRDWITEAIAGTPPMRGAEYVTVEALESLWTEAGEAFASEIVELARSGDRLAAREERRLGRRGAHRLPPRREQARHRTALRVPRDLHDAALGEGRAPAPAPRPRRRGVARRPRPRAAPRAAAAGPARGREERARAGAGRRRRRLPPARVDGAGGLRVPQGAAGARERRPRRARPRLVDAARAPARAGHHHGGRQGSVAALGGRGARLPRDPRARRGAPLRGRAPRDPAGDRRPGPDPRPVGRGRRRTAGRGARPLAARREGGKA